MVAMRSEELNLPFLPVTRPFTNMGRLRVNLRFCGFNSLDLLKSSQVM